VVAQRYTHLRRVAGVKWTRRRLLGVVGAAASLPAAAYLAGEVWGRDDDDRDADLGRYLQIVAHPDDDLFFLNPDLHRSLRRGGAHRTVVFTCGEADGRNAPVGSDGYEAIVPDYEGYTAARYNGLRRAYAQMAVGEPESIWERRAVEVVGGIFAEISTLAPARHVSLMFLNLWDDGALSPDPGGRIREIWRQTASFCPTMRPSGTPVEGHYRYSRELLTTAIAGIVEEFQPTVLRTMDLQPDFQIHDDEHPQYSDSDSYSDHQSHTGAAGFALAGLLEAVLRGSSRRVAVEGFRGYYNRRWPANLTRDGRIDKSTYITTYAWADHGACADPVGCGDLKLARTKEIGGYGVSTAYRYPGRTDWLVPASDGRLAAFGVLGGQAVMWSQTEAGSEKFTGPAEIGGASLLPGLTVLRRQDGLIQLFALRLDLEGTYDEQQYAIVTTVQQPGGGFGPWVELGNPHDLQPAGNRRRGIGLCAAGQLPDGRVLVCVRNFGKGLSARVQDGPGRWGPWRDLGGGEIQEGISIVHTAEGLGLLGAGRDGVHWWDLDGSGALRRRSVLTAGIPAGPVAAARLADDRIVMAVRLADSADISVLAQHGGAWEKVPVRGTGPGGTGAVGIVPKPNGGALLLARGSTDAAYLAEPFGDPKHAPVWKQYGPPVLDAPAAAYDSSGRLFLAGLGTDARLRIGQLNGRRGEWTWTKAGQ
jgi:LmbE family N-acetylglucosaminyl deacetylase